jgi:8-amino-7-oxononanoate synthase
MGDDAYGWIDRALTTIHRAGWFRQVRTIDGPGTVIVVEGQRLINFASNDYLGFASDSRLKQAAIQAIEQYGTGATGSRLVTGERPLHRELEQSIAALKGTEDALVFSSGYAANLGAIGSLVGKRDMVLGDRYNHASLKAGARVSGAQYIEYDHCCLESLKNILAIERSRFQRCLIVTDTVFSMDGDLCPLVEILDLAEQFEAMVLVDEAHGTGVFGTGGGGCVEHLGCRGRTLVQMGTLSKAIGAMGGYVAGSKSMVDFLRNRAASWIYSTGLSPADTGAALAGVKLIETEPDRRSQLWQNLDFLQTSLNQMPQLNRIPSASPIVCLGFDNVKSAMNASYSLKQGGIFAPAIRPPTVPTSRVRLTVMATHSRAQLERLVEILGQLVVRSGAEK